MAFTAWSTYQWRHGLLDILLPLVDPGERDIIGTLMLMDCIPSTLIASQAPVNGG